MHATFRCYEHAEYPVTVEEHSVELPSIVVLTPIAVLCPEIVSVIVLLAPVAPRVPSNVNVLLVNPVAEKVTLLLVLAPPVPRAQPLGVLQSHALPELMP